MEIQEMVYIFIGLSSFLFTTLIPTVIVLIKKIKACAKARTEAERQKAIGEIVDLAQGFVVEAETLYKDIDAIVKQNGKSCGAVKKDSVITKIQDACLTKGVAFDKEFWSTRIDELVKLTRQVNAK